MLFVTKIDTFTYNFLCQWPLFKFVHFLFESEVLVYNGGNFIESVVNNSSIINNLKTEFCLQIQ